MEYVIITLLTVSASALIVHKIINRIFGLHIKFKTLILCAICAVLINIVFPKIISKSAGISASLACSIVFAIVLAYLVGYYHEQQTEENQPNLLSENDDLSSCSLLPVDMESNSSLLPITDEIDIIPEAEEKVSLHTVNNSNIVADPENISNIVSEQIAVASSSLESEREQCGQMDNQTNFNSTVSLDELIEHALHQKNCGDLGQAFAIFNQALQLYPDSDSIPFIIIEMGNSLKLMGAYDDAITIFDKGRSNALLTQDDLLEQEFINIIAYLRITKNKLITHNINFIPFRSIPKDIMDEIECEFREWKSQTSS